MEEREFDYVVGAFFSGGWEAEGVCKVFCEFVGCWGEEVKVEDGEGEAFHF